MNRECDMVIKKIRDFLRGLKKPLRSLSESSKEAEHQKKPAQTEPGFEFLDGMSTATARFIIDREIGRDQLEKYDIKDIANKGRYYLAKIIDQDGRITDTVLIDKLSRSIHLHKRTNK